MNARSNLGWPSFGFYLLVLTHALLIGLLVWGCQKPTLDEAFEILTRREIAGDAEFSAADIGVLQRVWDRHPGFGRALLGKSNARFLEPTESGWLSRRKAHLSIKPEPDRPVPITFEGRGNPADFPMTLALLGPGIERKLELLPNQPQRLELSAADLSHPVIAAIEVRAGKNHVAGEPTWAIRVSTSNALSNREAP